MNETIAELPSPEERKKRYKASLNLPKTAFGMKANLAENEPKSRQRWDAMGLYERLLEARRGGEPFLLHDGPPYANGPIHLGHLLNKVLKDFVVRSQALLGRYCPYIPGWDCHGLPIEHKVMTELAAAGKLERIQSLPEGQRRMAVRRECRRTAEKYQRLQAEGMKRLLTLADYEHPYLTMSPEYEGRVLEVLAEMVAQGLVYRDLKPVHWSVANETALAEAELEYLEREDPSIYVRFPAVDSTAVENRFRVRQKQQMQQQEIAFLVWTTTPWTLPANRLIAVHPAYDYGLVRLEAPGGQSTVAVVARRRVEAVAAAAGARATVLAEVKGADLLGLTYSSPLRESSGRGRLVAADYVTLDDGTGLVHTAPGHGHEDYLTGLANGVEVYSPVRADGTFDDTVPEWLRGLSVWEANPRIVEALRASGHLAAAGTVVHSYPHDWRGKTPVIFRCTEQWFVAVDRPAKGHGPSLRELALAAAESGIAFVPAWGRSRLLGMLGSRPDWCISRQRSWGLPIPAFRMPDGRAFLTAASVRAVAGVVGREGSDAWFTRSPAELLAGYDAAADPEAPPGLDAAMLEKMPDILDVWFESGSSWNGAMRERGQAFPVDLYLEGSDQHRGWFQSSLLCGLGATGESPFRALLTHGFVVDKDGRKMSKSLGNTIEVEDLLADYGADVCRWWVSSLPYENDIKVDLEFFDAAGESYRKVRNTLRFLLSNLYDFDPTRDGIDLGRLPATSLDAWALAGAAALREGVLAAYARYDFRDAHLALRDFCAETLSAVYLDAVKDRLYCDRPSSPRRRATQSVLHRTTELLCSLLAPILPHTADEAWRELTRDDGACIHVREVPPLVASADPAWTRAFEIRDAALKALEDSEIDNKLDAGLVLPDPDGTLARFRTDLAEVLGVSRVQLLSDAANASEINVLDLRGEPRCERSWRRDETVKLRSDGGWLSDRDAEAVGIA
jgi:isoleucyl-tRNA synthetase